METEPGAHTFHGDGTVTGRCAGCLRQVGPADEYVIRYHATKRGGIFHKRCEPTGDGWYDVSGEAPDV